MDPVDVDVDHFDANVDLFNIGVPPADVNIDQGGVSEPDLEERWDSDAGLKPMQSEGDASDESVEVDDLLPEEAAVRV
jgi:hypothetical protein